LIVPEQLERQAAGEGLFVFIVLIDEPIKHVSQANTTLTPKPSNQKPFTIRQFSLGEEVNAVRDELYASHRGAPKMEACLGIQRTFVG